MHNFEKTIRDTAQNIHLSAKAKARMRERVMEYTEYKPLYHTVQGTAPRRVALYAYVYRAVSVALVAALVVGGTGTVYAAEGALPGDTLYGVKELTETVRSKVYTTDESRIAWNIERAQRRLDEARALAARNALTKERDEYLAQQFNTLVETVENDIADVNQNDTATAQALSLDLEFGVEAHTKALERTARVRVDKDPATLVAARVRTVPSVPPEASPTAAVATIAAFAVDTAPVAVSAQPVAAIAESVQPEQSEPAEEERDDAQQKAIEALTRTVQRQETRLKKEAARASARAQQEAQATIRAIEEVRKHIEEEQEDKAPEQERIETRALLEATLGEVHDARVRIKVEIEDRNSGSNHDEYDAHDEEREEEVRSR